MLKYLGDPVLTIPCEQVAGEDVLPLLDDLARVCRQKGGAGLAAPQIGVSKRVFVIALGGKLVAMVNPLITYFSPEVELGVEGCLSIPGFRTTIKRSRQVKVEWRAPDLQFLGATLGGFEARCLQHEVDHLDGRLITTGLGRNQRRAAERAVAKMLLQNRG